MNLSTELIFLRHPRIPGEEDFTLCRYSKRFKELFGDPKEENIVEIKWNQTLKLQVILALDSLYVTQIKSDTNKELWKSTEKPYTDAITNAGMHPHDCFNAHDHDTNRIDLGFWQEIKKTSPGDLGKFFANNHERIFVYVAEAIRFPFLFVLRSTVRGMYSPIEGQQLQYPSVFSDSGILEKPFQRMEHSLKGSYIKGDS